MLLAANPRRSRRPFTPALKPGVPPEPHLVSEATGLDRGHQSDASASPPLDPLPRPRRARLDRAGSPTSWRNRIVGHGEADPAQLLAHPANWRRHPPAQAKALAAVLGQIGWVAAVIVSIRSGLLIDGHLRVKQALENGELTVPVLYVDLDEHEERLVLATLDPIGEMATANSEALTALLAAITAPDELTSMLTGLADRYRIVLPGLTDPDVAPPPPDAGDVWVQPDELYDLGDHRLLIGDCTDSATVARVMGGELAECLWTDPPFGTQTIGKTPAHLRIDNDDPEGSDAVIAAAFRVAPMAPSAPFYVAAPTGPRGLNFRLALAAAGWRLHQELVWVKHTFVLGHSDYQLQHEGILYGYLPGPGRSGRGRHAGSRWYGDNAQASVLTYPKPAANRSHPTAKPVGLVEQCVRNSSKPGDIVFDGFVGGGTTLIACERLRRRCFALERDVRYAQATIERWQAFTGRKAVRA